MLQPAARPRLFARWLVPLLVVATSACAGSGPTAVDARGPAPGPSVEDEAAELCRLHVDRSEADERAFDRRMAVETWKLSSGILPPDAAPSNFGRLHAEAHGRCLDQVISALEGPGGEEALRILHAARVGCEAAPDASSQALASQCVHRRKLEIFSSGGRTEGPAGRETLDRLLRVGDGAPLSEAQKADYCRSRELAGSGHPFCD